MDPYQYRLTLFELNDSESECAKILIYNYIQQEITTTTDHNIFIQIIFIMFSL